MQTPGSDWSGTSRCPGREEGFIGHLRSHWWVDGGGTSVEIGSRLKIKHGSEEKGDGKTGDRHLKIVSLSQLFGNKQSARL